MINKVIFLDIDGVLRVLPQGRDRFGAKFHKHFEDNLRVLIEKTSAKIVISSTWRFNGFQEMVDMWKERGLAGEVIDITPDSYIVDDRVSGHERGYEIQSWLNVNPVEKYVILDDCGLDNNILESQSDNFVLCSGNYDHEDYVDAGYGLTKECVEKAITILN